jgi:hypothetical protein
MPRPRDLGPAHPDRKEIARYLLSRGLEDLEPPELASDAPPQVRALLTSKTRSAFSFPRGLAPQSQPLVNTDETAALPRADVVVITWTVDEVAALAKVLTPGFGPLKWHKYSRNFNTYAPNIRPHAPAQNSKRLGSYMPVTIGTQKVLCMKSELHLNQHGDTTGQGTATLPVKDFFKQIISEVKPSLFLTIGTAGSVFDAFELGDVVITRAAKFRLQNEFRNEPFNGRVYKSDWAIPTGRLADAVAMAQTVAPDLVEPPFAPPTTRFRFRDKPIVAPANTPDFKLDGVAMPAFHPILTTDYFEYGTTVNRLDTEGAAVEMGDAALGLAASEIANPPHWAVIRNMSDPVIDGALPAKQFHLNEQTTWAVGYYTAYGHYTSLVGALATWGVIAAL